MHEVSSETKETERENKNWGDFDRGGEREEKEKQEKAHVNKAEKIRGGGTD